MPLLFSHCWDMAEKKKKGKLKRGPNEATSRSVNLANPLRPTFYESGKAESYRYDKTRKAYEYSTKAYYITVTNIPAVFLVVGYSLAAAAPWNYVQLKTGYKWAWPVVLSENDQADKIQLLEDVYKYGKEYEEIKKRTEPDYYLDISIQRVPYDHEVHGLFLGKIKDGDFRKEYEALQKKEKRAAREKTLFLDRLTPVKVIIDALDDQVHKIDLELAKAYDTYVYLQEQMQLAATGTSEVPYPRLRFYNNLRKIQALTRKKDIINYERNTVKRKEYAGRSYQGQKEWLTARYMKWREIEMRLRDQVNRLNSQVLNLFVFEIKFWEGNYAVKKEKQQAANARRKESRAKNKLKKAQFAAYKKKKNL